MQCDQWRRRRHDHAPRSSDRGRPLSPQEATEEAVVNTGITQLTVSCRVVLLAPASVGRSVQTYNGCTLS